DEFLRRDNVRQFLQARIGHLDNAHVGLDGAERVVLGRDAGLGERIEQRGFPDIGQTHDSTFDGHIRTSWRHGKTARHAQILSKDLVARLASRLWCAASAWQRPDLPAASAANIATTYLLRRR